MKIKFCGAARTVTGSQHLLEISGKKILLDCGLYQGKREEAYDINRQFLFDPAELHCVVLSHAHIDHSGNLPMLYSKGFKGDIYTTSASRDLCSIMLLDSAHIQESDTKYVNKKRLRNNLVPYKPLYRQEDARNVIKNFKTVSYHKKFCIDGFCEKVTVEYFDAGHILGSAMMVLDIDDGGKKLKLAFTGDIGRPGLPILRDPEFIGDVQFIISESTYGGRVHDKSNMMDDQLAAVLKEAISRGGKIIIPAFSVGRTQEIIYSLSKLFESNRIPEIPIFIDSPLSTKATDIFRLHPECYDKEFTDLIYGGNEVFELPNLRYVKDVEESKSLNSLNECCIIISASGMAESGRVLHHLKNNIEDKNSTVLIVGFMAEHTLGRRLIEAKDEEDATVRIFGDEYNVHAKIVVLNSFSAHADKDELHDYFDKFDRKIIEKIFLVHGEPDQQEIFKESLKNMNFRDVEIPEKGQIFEI
ncbi:MAG: MBL fold metallo-hydrolase [Ignavibacteria bacterium]|nr:MBL fold metallo-hydrolase [Ignavibacteria bacterium]